MNWWEFQNFAGMASQPVPLTLITYKTFCNRTTGCETTGKEVEGFENPVFPNAKNERDSMKQPPGNLESSKSKLQSDIYNRI